MRFGWKSKFISALLVLTLTITLIPFASIGSEDIVNAATSHGAVDNYEVISKINAKGTETNPLVILELVPDESYAEIGYTIAGCEPVNIELLELDAGIKELEKFGTAKVSEDPVEVYKFELESDDIKDQWTSMGDDEIELRGYYEKVSVGEGEFIQLNQIVDDSKDEIVTVFQKDTDNGDFIWVTDDIPDDEIDEKDKDNEAPYIGDRIYTTRKDKYYKSTRYTYENKNLFLSNVLGLSEDKIKNYHVIVKTITPSELNVDNNKNWIDQSDLIYINSKSHSTELVKLWDNYRIFESKPKGSNKTFGNNDLTWELTMKILKRVIGIDGKDKRAALIIDKRIGSDTSSYTSKSVQPYQITYDGTRSGHQNGSSTGYNNNVYKLFLMTQLMDARVFYNLFLSDHNPATEGIQSIVSEAVVDGKKTGSCTIQGDWDKQNYWNPYTFSFCQKDGSKASSTTWSTDQMKKDYHLDYNLSAPENLNGYIYGCKGDKSLAAEFNSSATVTSTSEGDFTKVLKTYAGTQKDGTSINRTALAIRYILSEEGNYTGLDRELNVLELQPCADFSLTDFRIRMLVPKFIGTVTISKQTTAEFVGKIEDLNSKYHLIYIGMNIGKFNTKNVGGKEIPDYNDDALDGKVYLHVGDKYNTSWFNDSLYGTSNANQVRMPGNDITKLKREHLENYLSGGFPVVVTKRMYDCDTTSIDKTSQIYQFINNNKSTKSNIIDESRVDINEVLSPYIAAYKPSIVISNSPVEYSGTTDSQGRINSNTYINAGSNASNRTLTYTFKIEDGNQNQPYDVRLYIDSNADGKFEDSGDPNEIAATRVFNSDGNFHTLTRTLPGTFVGVIPWKLEVISQANTNKRDNVTGLCAVKRSSTATRPKITVLQVRDDSGATLNLQENYNNNQNFRKYTQYLEDFEVKFETIRVTDFQNWYNGSKFDNTDETKRASTDKLCSKYDMIIFGFNDMYDNISNSNGALDNVKYFINQGHSVMFTHDVTSYNNGHLDEDGKTGVDDFGMEFNEKMRAYLCMDRFNFKGGVTDPDTCKSPDGVEYPLKQGYTYSSIYRMIDPNSNQKTFFKNFNFVSKSTLTFYSKEVAKLNDGQLTQYPYKINDGKSTFNVAETHYQYYQLNLNDDDLVVWYTLAGTNPLYANSPNDAANNYYIYSKGNVMYTGVGHSQVDGNGINNENEIKLFVNTMIAAYKNAKQPPTISVTNKDSYLGADNIYYTYLNVDKDDEGSTEFDDTDVMNIEFIPWEFNFYTGELGVKVYKSGSTVNYPIFQKKEDGTIIPMTTSYNTENPTYIKLKSDVEYYIEYPKKDFNNVDGQELIFEVVDIKNTKNKVNMKLLRRTLFNLK